jgi:hypothetical protein
MKKLSLILLGVSLASLADAQTLLQRKVVLEVTQDYFSDDGTGWDGKLYLRIFQDGTAEFDKSKTKVSKGALRHLGWVLNHRETAAMRRDQPVLHQYGFVASTLHLRFMSRGYEKQVDVTNFFGDSRDDSAVYPSDLARLVCEVAKVHDLAAGQSSSSLHGTVCDEAL